MLAVGLCMLLYVSTALGQVPGVGKCPKVEVMQGFDVKKYYGTWYEITKFYTSFESGQKCNTATYSPKEDGHFEVFNTGLNERNQESNATGDGYIPDPTEPAKIKVKFSAEAPYADYWILDTDYDTYTLIYSCVDVLGVSHLEFSWILSRKTTLTPEVRQKLFSLVESYGIKSSNYKDDDQLSCPRDIY